MKEDNSQYRDFVPETSDVTQALAPTMNNGMGITDESFINNLLTFVFDQILG